MTGNSALRGIGRRRFLRAGAEAMVAGALLGRSPAVAQDAGERPQRGTGITILNPRARVPVGIIIDDSTCLVNLNRFAMPQFDAAFAGSNPAYHREWREWPVEIPDRFVRKFAEWAMTHGVKGKYSIVPFPACVGRVDRMLPGWTQGELNESLELVRTLIMPHWDIHPEMVTHTRVIDTKTGHPYADHSLKFMENWDWTTGRSADEIGEYLAYALNILKNAGLPCEGVTTPGGFGNRALPQLSQASFESVRAVFKAEVPHYFRHLYDKGAQSVAPRVEYARDLHTADPRCVVSVIACTGDWTGGWDCTPPGGADKFITADLQQGRMVEVIERGEPALILGHWTGIYWNGKELGFEVLQEVVRRLHARYDNLIWMKLSELARYWGAKELTAIKREADQLVFEAPFASPDFTVRIENARARQVKVSAGSEEEQLKEVRSVRQLQPGAWTRDGEMIIACFNLRRGSSRLEVARA